MHSEKEEDCVNNVKKTLSEYKLCVRDAATPLIFIIVKPIVNLKEELRCCPTVKRHC